MKRKLTALVISLVFSTQSVADDVLTVMSPYGTKTQVQQLVSVLQQQLSQMDAGDTLTVLSGADGATITKFTIPDVPESQKVKAIRGMNQKPIAQISAFANSANSGYHTGTINLPAVLNQLAAYHRDKADILLLGSLSFDLPNMEQTIASGQSLPADSNLLKGTSESTFGTRNIGERFKGGYRFHWLVSDKTGVADLDGAIRFWFMYLQFQGADIVSLTHDKAVVLDRLNKKAQPLNSNYQLQLDNAQIPQTLFDRQVTKATETMPLNTQQRVSVAIRWENPAVDLDLFAHALGQSLPIYYSNPVSQKPKARHLKDIRSGASGTAFLETIIYDQEINACELIIGVNLYSGIPPQEGLDGIIRLAIGDMVFEKPFTFTASQGDEGQDAQISLRRKLSTKNTKVFTLSDFTNKSCAR